MQRNRAAVVAATAVTAMALAACGAPIGEPLVPAPAAPSPADVVPGASTPMALSGVGAADSGPAFRAPSDLPEFTDARPSRPGGRRWRRVRVGPPGPETPSRGARAGQAGACGPDAHRLPDGLLVPGQHAPQLGAGLLRDPAQRRGRHRHLRGPDHRRGARQRVEHGLEGRHEVLRARLSRYLIVEDSGAGAAPGGVDTHLDVWVGGEDGTKSAVDAVMARITGNTQAELNPPPGRKVIRGPIFSG